MITQEADTNSIDKTPHEAKRSSAQQLIIGINIAKLVIARELPQLASATLFQKDKGDDERFEDFIQRKSQDIKRISEKEHDAFAITMGG